MGADRLYSDKYATRPSHRSIEGCALVGALAPVTTGGADILSRSARSIDVMLA